MENNNTNNIIQRAKKISQFDRLDINDFLDVENLWLILGYRNDDDQLVENYKINMLDLAELLIQTGLMSGESGAHKIIYNLNNITTQSANKFKGNVFTIFLTPVKGYKLPESADDIIVRNCNIETYNPISGTLKISTNSSDNISITVDGVLEEYNLTINTDNLSYQILEGEKTKYHINDIVVINIMSNDSENYGIPEINNIPYSNISVISYVNVDDNKKLTFKFTGTGDATINLTGYIIINYYFGHSVVGDNVLTYDEYGKPIDIGSDFTTLHKVHNDCPIDFNSTYTWPSGLGVEGTIVYVIVPKDFFIPEANMYNNKLYRGYTRIVTETGMTRNIQNDEYTNEPMCYSLVFNTVEYWVYCISREGISGEDSYKDNGYISDKPVKLFWNTNIPNIIANQPVYIDKGSVEVMYGNRNIRSINNDELTITLYDSEGTYDPNTSTYLYNGEISGDKPMEVIFKITWNSKNLSDYKYVDVYSEKTVQSIRYLLTQDTVTSEDSLELSRSNIRFVYNDSSTGYINGSCEVSYECNKGTIETSDNYARYIAPVVDSEDTATITVICVYNSKTYTFSFELTISPITYTGLQWSFNMPSSIYDNNTLNINTDCFKIKSNGDLEEVTDNLQTLTVSQGTIENNIYTPPTVEVDTIVTFILQYKDLSTRKTIIVKKFVESVEVNGTYWYIGINMPNIPYDPESNIATSDGLGWRRIEGDITSYTKNNPIYDGVNNEGLDTSNESFEFYFGIPQGCLLADYFNDNINSNYILVKTVIIGNITYEFYKAFGDSFDVIIYYNGGTPVEPTGQTSEPEPTGEEPTNKEISGEDIVFTEQPTIELINEKFGNNPIKPEEPQTLNMNSLTGTTGIYLVFPMDWLELDENENVVKPKIKNSLGFELSYELSNTIEVNGIEFGIFSTQFNKDTYTIEF